MRALRRAWIRLTGTLAWRFPAERRRLLLAFSRAEQGSALDMLAAVRSTQRRDLRLKYFRHAMDEWRHSGLFRRAASQQGVIDATESGRDEAGLLLEHGIVGGRTLFERMGELDFLAFVYVAESDAVEQFDVYRTNDLPDEHTRGVLPAILKDEAFHVSYSRQELLRTQDGDLPVERLAAVRRVRRNRIKEGWLRFSRDIGVVVGSVWLWALYALVVGPFRMVARLDKGGFQPASLDARPLLDQARSEA
ncbi:MAG: hypothetical protein VX265_10375 [Myxococcota bacterium]|nr:hypothetical protein [Myxococcota bacterium]MEC8424227.1 hypothetical protein [Myxococcota bacterium]